MVFSLDFIINDCISFFRSQDSRWIVWEKSKKSRIQTDPTLVFKSRRIIPNENYIISETSSLARIPPQSVLTNLRAQLLQLPNHVLVWDGYGVFDWDALNALNNVHQTRFVAEQVQEEFTWLRNKNVDTNSEINKYMYRVWHDSVSDKDRESLLCRRLLTDGIIKEMLDICNDECAAKGENSQYAILNNTNMNVNSDTKYIHLIINVSRNSTGTYVTPANESGSHWTYLCIDREMKTAYYCDSLGWSIPIDLQQKLSQFCPSAHQIKLRLLHQPNGSSMSHVCTKDCSEFAPLQKCSNVCGVAALALCILSFDEPTWKAVFKLQTSGLDKQLLALISQPTVYSDELRMTVMSCLETREIRLDLLKDTAHTIKLQPNKETQIESNENSANGSYDNKRGMTFELKDLLRVALKRKRTKEDTVPKTVRKSNQLNTTAYESVIDDNNDTCTAKPEDAKRQTKYRTIFHEQIQANCNTENDNAPTVKEKTPDKTYVQSVEKERNITQSTTDPSGKVQEKYMAPLMKEHSHADASFEKKLLEKSLHNRKMKKMKEIKRNAKRVTQTTIKSIFEKINERTEKQNEKTRPEPSHLKTETFSEYVYTEGVSLKGLSKVFFKNIGRNLGKNEIRNEKRKNSPLIQENGRVVGLQRQQSIKTSKSIDTMTVGKIKQFLSHNGPVVKTQTVCEFYQSLKQSNSRLMSGEFVEKLGKYFDITQIYVNGTGYLIEGQYDHLMPIIQQLEALSKTKENENFKSVIESKIKDIYIDALNSLKNPYDRQIMKGLMATLTNPDFMTKLEGKQNKTSYRNSKDTFRSQLNKYKEIEKTSLIVRNDMTNNEQRALTKRLIGRRKKKELQTVFKGRGRLLKSEQYPELAAVLELCFDEMDILNGGGGLESHPRLTDGVLYRSCDNSLTMKKAREIVLLLAPDDFQISLSTCYNYTENYRVNSHQAVQHHAGKNVNANISLNPPPRTGVLQFVVNLHWSTANVNLILDDAHEKQDDTFVDSKDAKSIVCANIAPVQKPGKSWSKREYLDHDWDQSRTFAITPMTHLILQTEKNTEIKTESIIMRTKRTGSAITVLNISFFEPETAFRSLNEIFLLIIDPKTTEFFRNPVTGDFKRDLVFVVDNGPSTAPGNMLVKMCLIRIFLLLNLNSLCQVSYAEYHSKRNPVERVHAEENKALSRHGPFIIDTTLLKPGSTEHKSQMEEMLNEVSSCLRTGQFNNDNLITMRGTTDGTNIFTDENHLKHFMSLSEDSKETFDGTYCVDRNPTAEELDIVWNIDLDFHRKYVDDFNEINDSSIMNKYTFKITKENTHRNNLQPIPDYMKYAKTEELHYCDYSTTKRVFELSENIFVQNETDFFLPSQVLNLAYLVFENPPNHIKTLLSLLTWVTLEEYEKFVGLKDEEQKRVAEKDIDYITWKSHDLYKMKKTELISMCKNKSKPYEGTKVELVKRLSGSPELQNKTSYTGDLSSISNTVSGIAAMSMAYIRLVLTYHGVKTFGSKEELVLRLYILKHQPDLLFKKEKQGLLDMIKVCQHFIQIQYQQNLMSLDSERMFPSNKLSTTRQKVLNTPLNRQRIQLPSHVDERRLGNLFQPLIDYINNDLRHPVEEKISTSLACMTTPGNTVKVKWLKDEVNGSGWHPGWYSAIVTNYNKDTDELTVEYDSEKGYPYKMHVKSMLSKGMIEPSKPLIARIEATERIQTIGQTIEIKWSKDELAGTDWEEGWYEAVVIGIDAEEDTVIVRYEEEPACTYNIEVTPAINSNSVRIKKIK